jgi:hypothetical protein
MAQIAAARQDEYKANRAKINADVSALVAAGNFEEALKRAAPYARFGDPELAVLNGKATEGVKAARERELLAKINASKPQQYRERILYYGELEKLRPDNKNYSAEWKKNRAALDRIEEAAQKKALVADRARRRREGVSVGMTKDEVLMSSWGRPQHINTTTTSRGSREQWVYGIGNYLYFDEAGRLYAIQN